MQPPEVSVIIAVHNGGLDLANCLFSLERSINGISSEIVIVNDGSLDASEEIINKYRIGNSTVHYIKFVRNVGLPAALNAGISISTGKLIARIDADDMIIPDRFHRQIRFLSQEPAVDGVGSSALIIRERSSLLGYQAVPTSAEAIQREIHRRNVLIHPSMVLRRNSFEALGWYDATIYCPRLRSLA